MIQHNNILINVITRSSREIDGIKRDRGATFLKSVECPIHCIAGVLLSVLIFELYT